MFYIRWKAHTKSPVSVHVLVSLQVRVSVYVYEEGSDRICASSYRPVGPLGILGKMNTSEVTRGVEFLSVVDMDSSMPYGLFTGRERAPRET